MGTNVIDKIYINGEFVTPHGTEMFDLFNPAAGQVIGRETVCSQPWLYVDAAAESS